MIVIKQNAKKRFTNFTNETKPSARKSAAINEIIENTTTKKNDKKWFLCLNVDAISWKLKIFIIWMKAMMLMIDIANICGYTLSNERKKLAIYCGVI